jgi:hypothetical protein
MGIFGTMPECWSFRNTDCVTLLCFEKTTKTTKTRKNLLLRKYASGCKPVAPPSTFEATSPTPQVADCTGDSSISLGHPQKRFGYPLPYFSTFCFCFPSRNLQFSTAFSWCQRGSGRNGKARGKCNNLRRLLHFRPEQRRTTLGLTKSQRTFP